MADYQKKVQSTQRHLQSLTSGLNVHLDGATAQPLNSTTARRLLKVVINTKGIVFTVRSGSRILAVYAATSAEGTYEFGAYCENGLSVDVASGSGSATVVYDK